MWWIRNFLPEPNPDFWHEIHRIWSQMSIKCSADCRKLIIQHALVTVVTAVAVTTCTWNLSLFCCRQFQFWFCSKFNPVLPELLVNSNAMQMNNMLGIFTFSPHEPIFLGAQIQM
jgi:hypothetical protein